MRAGFLVGTLNPSVGGGISGFIPDAGWNYTTTPTGFESSFTITRGANDLGTPPVLGLYDDFVSAIAGAMPATRTPNLGTCTWTSSGGTTSPIFARLNASGTGPAFSMLNNEFPGVSGVPFGRSGTIQFNGEFQGMYISYNETQRGSSPAGAQFRNGNGGGGGYYKHNWVLETGDYGGTGWDGVIPDFLEQSSDQTLIAGGTSWSAGTLTIQTQNFGALRFPGVTTWNCWLRNSTNANYNNIGPVVATYIDDTHFSIPLAVNPGVHSGTTAITIPGGGDLHQSGTPSNQIITSTTSNRGIYGTHTIAGDTNGITLWDPGVASGQTGWNTVCSAFVGDPTNPTTAPGIIYSSLYNAINNQAYEYKLTTQVIFANTATDASFNHVQCPGLIQNTGVKTWDRCNFYVTLGFNCLNGFCVSDGPTLASSTFTQDATHTAWAAGQATITLRQGRATALAGLYLWWRDRAANFIRVGQFAPAVAIFDFYVSAAGNSANPGTVAQPWDVNSLNTKRATYKSKRVGIIGTVDVSGLMGALSSGQMGVDVQGGTAANPTYIGASDASGNYLRRGATIQGNGNGTFGGTNSKVNAMFGHGNAGSSLGYVTFDGLRFTGAGPYGFMIGNNNTVTGPYPGIIIQNCESTGNSGATNTGASGVNCGPWTFYSHQGLIFQDNYTHDNIGPTLSGDASHFSAIYSWGNSSGLIIRRSTFVNTGNIHGKEATQANTTISQCYIDMTLKTPSGGPSQNASCIFGFNADGGTGTLTSFTNNICIGYGAYINTDNDTGQNGWSTPVQISNNTYINAGSDTSGAAGSTMYEMSAGIHPGKYYNQLYSDNSAGGYGYVIAPSDFFTVLDYNIYGTGGKWSTVSPGGQNSGTAVTRSTLAAWQTATGGDAHASTAASAGFTNSGARALQYTITAGVAFSTGKVGGVIGGASCNVGAWDGTVTQIGSYTNGVPD